MKVLVEGHLYEVPNFENKGKEGQLIQFIQKEPKEEGSTELVTVSDGCTNEDLLGVVIDRLSFLQSKFPCKENACAITHLQEAKMWLEERTRNRVAKQVEGKNEAH